MYSLSNKKNSYYRKKVLAVKIKSCVLKAYLYATKTDKEHFQIFFWIKNIPFIESSIHMGPFAGHAFCIVFTIPHSSQGQESMFQLLGSQWPINFLFFAFALSKE